MFRAACIGMATESGRTGGTGCQHDVDATRGKNRIEGRGDETTAGNHKDLKNHDEELSHVSPGWPA